MSDWAESWTSAQKVAAFKAWLAANPVTVFYPLIAPTVIAGAARTLAPYTPKTVISAENGTCSVSYIRDINAMYRELLDKIAKL
jgi:hypothetical protein